MVSFMENKSKRPGNNYSKYYFGIDKRNDKTMLTTSSRKIAMFLNVSRITIYRHLKASNYYICDEYVIGATDIMIKQDKGNYRQFRDETSLMRELRRQIKDQNNQ